MKITRWIAASVLCFGMLPMIASADVCFRSFDIDRTKNVSMIGILDGSDAIKPMSCGAAEELRTRLYVENPEYFRSVAGKSPSEYYDELKRQLDEVQTSIDDLENKLAAGQVGEPLLIATDVLLYEAAKYQLLLCLLPEVTVSKYVCGVALVGTLRGSYQVLSGSISENELSELVQDLRQSLDQERSRLSEIREKLMLAQVDEAQRRTEERFFLLCSRIEASCLK